MALQQELEKIRMLFHPPQAPDMGTKRSLELQIGWQLDPGIRLKNRPNEDSLFVEQGTIPSPSGSSSSFALFVVADGMGGLESGREASQAAGQTLIGSLQKALSSFHQRQAALLPLLKAGVESANQVIYQRNQERKTRMGTTMTAMLVVGSTAYVAHVGDSRLYLSHPPSGLLHITHDHSLVAALVDAGVIGPDDIYTHPYRNQIYRCLGEKPVVDVELHTFSLSAGDTLLLCSDGLWEMVRDAHIACLLTTSTLSASQIANELIQAALSGGGEDNVSAIVVRVASTTTKDEKLGRGDLVTRPGKCV